MAKKKAEDQDSIVLNSKKIYNVMQGILLREEKIDKVGELFWMMGITNSNCIQYVELVEMDDEDPSNIEPMNIYRWAVMKGSPNVILVHNHPSGDLQPTEEEKDLTDRLIQVGNILNINVVEHLIITNKTYLSFADTGLLAELKRSEKWVPKFELEERIHRQIATEMKFKGIDSTIIADTTGLTIEEIEELD